MGEVLYSTTHEAAVPFSCHLMASQSTPALSALKLVGAGQVGI